MFADKRQVFLRRRTVFFLAQNGGRTRKRAEHQAVPGREDFVVVVRTDSFGAHGGHFAFCGCEERFIPGGDVWFNHAQDILPGQRRRMAVVQEIARRRDAEIFCGDVEFLDGEQLGKFGLRPTVKFPLVALSLIHI